MDKNVWENDHIYENVCKWSKDYEGFEMLER